MDAEVKSAFGQWMVVPKDGGRGGIPVASRKAGIQLCKDRGWRAIDEHGHLLND